MLSCRQTQVLRLCEVLFVPCATSNSTQPDRDWMLETNANYYFYYIIYGTRVLMCVPPSDNCIRYSSPNVWALIVRAHHFHVVIIAAPCQLQLQSTLTWRDVRIQMASSAMYSIINIKRVIVMRFEWIVPLNVFGADETKGHRLKVKISIETDWPHALLSSIQVLIRLSSPMAWLN